MKSSIKKRFPLVRKPIFTGSTETGNKLMAQCVATVKKLSRELGGNAPYIVFADAELDAAVEGAMVSTFRNSGQTCVCANCFLVHGDVYDDFCEKLSARVSELRVGDGRDELVQQGPLMEMAVLLKVEQHIAIFLANDTQSGLAAYSYTRDQARYWRVSEALEYGMVAT